MNKQISYSPKEEPAGIVIGIDEKLGEAVTVTNDAEANQNVAVYGPAGSGKSVNFVKPNILTCIDSKTSFVVTDPGGILYRDTAKLAREKGMVTRVLNLSDAKFSDGWDCFAEIRKLCKNKHRFEADKLADVLAKTIIANTGKGFDDPYHAEAEMNLLILLIKYVAESEHFEGEEHERHIGTCYDILIELIKGKGKLSALSSLADYEDEPAKVNWLVFSALNQHTKNSIMFGLKERLGILGDNTVREVLSHDEIDLALPGTKPCAYYIISSVMISRHQKFLSLFLTSIIHTLIIEAELGKGRLEVPVRFLLDEFKAIGKIDGLEEILASARKFGISFSIIIQSPVMLNDMYPDRGRFLLDNCAVHIAMGVNDFETAKAVAERAGLAEIEINKKGKPKKEKISVIDADDILRMGHILNKQYIVSIKGENIYPVMPYACFNHKLYPDIRGKNNEQDPLNHIPDWWEKEKLINMKNSFKGMSERDKINKVLSGKYNVSKFRDILRECIGNDSQSAFAEKCGISKENLNRLLNSDDPSKPSKSTLRKIADNADSRAAYNELLSACGYDAEKTKKTVSFEDRAAANARNIRDGIRKLLKDGMIYQSIEDFLDIYSMLYSDEHEKYFCVLQKEYLGGGHQNAENTVVVKSCFENSEKDDGFLIRNSCSTWFVLYYTETKSGKVVITDIATDGKSIEEAGGDPSCKEGFFANSRDMEFVYDMVSKTIETSSFKSNAIDIIAHGFGFYLEQMPDNISEFLEKHKESIIQEMPDEKDYIDSYIKYPENLDKDSTCMNVEPQGMGLEYAIGRYMLASADPISGYDGYGAMIAAAMRYETDISFSWWPATTGSETENIPCIMLKDFDEDYPWEDDYEDVYYALQKYAKELGISKIGTCITHYPKKIKEYDVKDK